MKFVYIKARDHSLIDAPEGTATQAEYDFIEVWGELYYEDEKYTYVRMAKYVNNEGEKREVVHRIVSSAIVEKKEVEE